MQHHQHRDTYNCPGQVSATACVHSWDVAGHRPTEGGAGAGREGTAGSSAGKSRRLEASSDPRLAMLLNAGGVPAMQASLARSRWRLRAAHTCIHRPCCAVEGTHAAASAPDTDGMVGVAEEECCAEAASSSSPLGSATLMAVSASGSRLSISRGVVRNMREAFIHCRQFLQS